MQAANQSAILERHYSYFHGMAGVGLANLYFYVRTRKMEYLAKANHLADALLKRAQAGDKGRYWEVDKLLHLGLGYGQSGVALFLLRLYELTGREDALLQGRQALEFDLSHGFEIESGVMSFPRAPSETTFVPYLEEGSAGIAKVSMRYGIWDRMDVILADTHRKYAGFAGLLYGLSSFIDVLTDAYVLSHETRFLEMARRPMAGIRDMYLIEREDGLATPGDGLFRVSCDYATGVAGVLRTLYRFRRCDAADFALDEVSQVVGRPVH
jgi:lantibiotic modifying enzyme